MAKDQEGTDESESTAKKHINLALSESDDAEIIRLYEVVKAVSGVSNKTIFELGLNTYKESDDFREKAKLVKDLVG